LVRSGEFPTGAFAAHRPNGFVVAANVLSDCAVALLLPTRVLYRSLNCTALILLAASQSVTAVRSPGEPLSVREGSVDDFDADILDPRSLAGGSKAMVPIGQIVFVFVGVVHHEHRRKFFTTAESLKVSFDHAGFQWT
jgi:hypothetical protein